MLDIDYAEYDATHKSDFVFDVPEGHECWLLVLTHTPAVFLVNDAYVEYPPNCMVLYRPMQRIYYRACSGSYSNDWLRFDTDEVYVTSTPIPGGIPFVLRNAVYFHKLFQLIVHENERDGENKEIIIEKLLQVVFHKLFEYSSNVMVSKQCKSLQDLRSEIYQQPNRAWSLKQMSAMVNLSPGRLEGIYKSNFGVTCMEDVIASRVNLAKKYLLNSHHTIAEIAELCGYHNGEHFHRQFKKFAGTTPGKYRTGFWNRDAT